jgi:hypothetical protein
MKTQNEENLKGLFERFVDAEQAEMCAEDVREGEQILGEHPAPEPRKELIDEIKAEVAGALAGRKANALRRAVYKIAVAAVIIVVGAVGVRLFERGGEACEIISSEIWESENIAADDIDLATLTAEIEEMEGEALALQLGENGGNGGGELTELEMELIEINNNFWKG